MPVFHVCPGPHYSGPVKHPVINLRQAYLCVDCEGISDDPHGCVRCGCSSVIPLARLLS
jgi:hypothetical protein